MKLKAFSKVLTVLACALMLCVSVPTLTVADQAQYIYDDLGRLSQVIDGQGNVATYNYDAVGNLLSITRNTGGVGAPTITGLTPNTGNAGTSVNVSIAGTNLTGAALATDNPGIFVRNVLTTPTSIAATFQISFAASTGATAVTVTTTTGSATTSFSVNASAPIVSTLSPTSGPVTRLVTITGNGFSSTAALNQIRFNGILATTLSATATVLTAQVPSGATTGPVTVGGLVSNGVMFTVANAGPLPTLTSVSPNVGSVQGGQQTTLTGTGFIAGTTVKIGNKAAAVLTLVSATSLIVQVPASIVGLADVVVTNTNGDALIQNGYTYLSGAPQKIGTITPTMGLINIPRNTPVTVSFSRPVDRTSITTTTFAFTQGATPVAGTFSYDFGDTVVTFRPAATLAASTAYTLALTQAIKSVDGVPLDGGFVGSFTTGTSSDTVSPTVTISPANGATNVPFNTTVLLTFSEPINPNTVNGATVVVSQGDIRSGTLTFGQQNTFAVFTPASPFFPTASATVTVLGQVTDMAGNALQGTGGVGTSVVSSFTTSSVADRLPPVVLQVVPFTNATGISTRTSLSATFSESVNPTTISPTTFQVTSGGAPIAGSFSFSNLNQTVLFIPDNPFPPVATVNVSISNISDVVGNVMVLPFTSSFQTQSAIDNIRPSVVRPSPSTFPFQPNPPLNTNMPLNTRVMIGFDERINPATVNGTTFSLALQGQGTIPSTITVAPDGLSAMLTPTQPLLPHTFYVASWTTGIQDLVGNQLLNANSVSFTTGPVATDVTLPTVLDASPRTGMQNLPINATVTVLFSEPVSFTSITQQTVVLSTGGVPVNTQFTLERNNTVLRIKPANLLQLQANKFYELTVAPGVLDLAGNSLGSGFSSSFTTGSATNTAAPTVTTFVPAISATNVSRTTTVSITFSEPVNPITVTPTSINIASGAVGAMSVSPDLRMVTFTPTFPFFANSAISIQITGVEDLTGNTGSGSSNFTTAVAPGTVVANLPTLAAGTANPSTLFSDGQTTTTITISNISKNSTLVPNGTIIGVLPFDSSVVFNGGGTILDGVQSQADPRVRLFTTLGGNVTFTYRSPNEALPLPNGGGVRVVSVDAAGAPVAVIGDGRVTFVRGSTFVPTVNPSTLLANGSSTGEMSLVVRDQFANPIPAGQQVALTFEPVVPPTNASSLGGGTINGGTVAPDARFKLFTATTGGRIDFTYTAPTLAGGQSAVSALQMAEVDSSGNLVKKISTADGFNDRFFLNGTTGFTGPQPVVVAISPAHTQSSVGTNATVDALFSQSLDIATVTSSTFSVTSGGAIPGAYAFLATDRGPNTLVRFTPTVPFAPSGTFTVAITVGIKNTTGIPLLGATTATFSTGAGTDTTAPTIIQVTPPDGSLDIATNRLITVEFSEPMNVTTLNAITFTVSAGGTPVSGRLAMVTGPGGPNTLATFTPSQLLSATNPYAVTLTAGLLDTASNPLGAVSSNFTTGAGVDTFRPSVVSTSPPMLDFTSVTNVPLDAKVIVQFSEPMNPLTLTSNSFQLAQSTAAVSFSLIVPGTLAISSDLRSVTFTPAQRLIPNGTHRLTLGAGLADLAGNPLLPLPPLSVSSFITGVDATDSTPLTVVSMSPVDTDTGVPINAPVVLKFSKSVAPTTVNGATVVVTGSSGPIVGTVTFEQNNQLARWKPANLIQFAPNTLHTVSVSTGVTDLAGVPMAASFGGSFTTGAGADTTIPTIISSNPVNNASGVSRLTTIAVTMSEPINPATVVVGSTVLISGPGAPFAGSVPGAVTVSPDRRTITVVPAQPLFGNQSYSLSVSGVEDIAGNKANSNSSTTFTTGFAAGTTLSAIPSSATVIANPTTLFADGLQTTTILVSNVALSTGALAPNGTTIAVTADPALSGNSAGGVILGGTPSPTDPRFKLFTTVGGGFSLTYVTPNRPDLVQGGTGVIQLAGVDTAGTPVRSSAGNLLIGSGNVTLIRGDFISSSFFNPGSPSGAKLRANGTSVADVSMTLSKSASIIAPASSRLAVTVDSVFAVSSGGTINGGIVANDPRFRIFTTLPDGTIEFTYTAPFLASGTGTAVFQAAAVDDGGTILRQIAFQTGVGLLSLDATTGSVSPQPVVVALSPAHSQSGAGTNARIVAKFSQPLDPTSVLPATFSVTNGFTAINGTRTVSASERGPNTLATFIPSAPLPANSSFVVAITSGIKNTLGEPLLLNSLSSATFSTGPGADTTAPTIVQLNPPNGVGAVGTNNVITAEFSEPINATTVSTTTFSLTAGGVPVNGRVKVVTGPRGPNTQAIFTPDQLLGSSISYAVALGTGITDTASNPLAAPFSSSFGTGTGIDNFQPSLLSVSPQNQMTGVPLNARVTARFSEPINPLTITATTFGLSGPPFGQGVPGTRTIAPDLLSVIFTPAQLLLPNTSYSVLVQTNGTDVIRDMAGNAVLTPGFSAGLGSFTTGSGPVDTAGPQVLVVSPADTNTAVPVNGQVVMQFSEPLAAPSVHGQTVTVTAGGVPIPGTFTLEQANTVVRWKLPVLTQFAPNMLHTVTVTTGVTDMVGNPMATSFTSTFTTGAGTDIAVPTVVSVSPTAGSTNVSRSATITVTLSEAINPATVVVAPSSAGGTFNLSSFGVISGIVQGSMVVSQDRKTLTFTPAFPLLSNQVFSVGLQQIEDTAGNKVTFSSNFTTAVAAGTNLTSLPTSAVVSATPAQLFADGQTTTTVTITNVVRGGILVPNGTVIGVTADPAYNNTSAGGTIIGGVPSAEDPRIRLFTTLNGTVTLTYQSPNRPDLFNGGTGIIQAASVDAVGAPIGLLGTASVTLVRGGFAVVDANPSNLLANGTSFSDVSISVTDSAGGVFPPVPAGATYAVTTEPVFTLSSFPGTLNGGTVASDNRFKLFTTIPGGVLNFTYTAPVLAAGETKSSVIQIAKVDGAGTILSQLVNLTGSPNINLNGSTGSSSPQPMVVAVSPTNGQTTVGTNATIVAKFSLPLNRTTVVLGSSGSFTITQGFVHVPGALAFSASDRGPDTIVTFTPAAPFTINSSVAVTITAGVKSVSGETLRAASSNAFSIGLVADAVAPTVTQVNPVDGSGAVPTNSFVSAEFSEPINATTIEGTTFAVTAGGSPVAGRFTFSEGVRGKNSIVTFIPNQLLTPNTTYVLSITNGVKDSSGNGVIPATMTFTTTGGTDNIVPTVLSSIPTSGATGFPATGTPVSITISEPVNPLTVSVNTVSGLGGTASPPTVVLSANNTVITVTPSQPLFAGTQYIVIFQGIRDVAGNPLVSASFSFTTELAPGTINLPTSATVTANPPQLFANGVTTSQVTISNISRGGTLVPNGTVIAVTAAPAFSASLGGTISGASVGTSVDGRFQLFSTFGAQVVVTYTTPNLGLQDSGASGQAAVQVASIDLDTRPVSLIGIGFVSLIGANSAIGSSTPTSLVANGTSTAAITVTIRDNANNLVPDGTRIGITAASVFSTSAGGTILGGTTSSVDPRIQVFTTVSGQITATYRAGTSPGTAFIQSAAVDGNGLALRNLGQFTINLQ